MNKQKVLCFYHSRDLDGWTSAAIVKDRYPDTTLMGWDYGDPVPDTIDFYYYDLVFLVDISFDPETMQILPSHVIWIDHHISAIRDSEKHGYALVNGIRNSEYAACELTWDYTHEGEMPEGVHLAGLYDSFRHMKQSLKTQKKVMHFQYAARANVSNPEEAAQLLTLSAKTWITAGKNIFRYLKTEAGSTIKNAFPVEILGHKGLMVNATRFNPSNFDIGYTQEFFGCFHYTGKKWVVSLYSDGKLDVSTICKEFGGGGHAGAAGFQIDTTEKLNRIIIKN